MKTLLFSVLISSFASAYSLLPADNPLCGSYYFKSEEQQIFLPIYYKTGLVQNYNWIYKKIDKLIKHFEANGDTNFKNLKLCYGIYNDKETTGSNSMAQVDQTKQYNLALLMGRQNMYDLQFDTLNFLNNQLQTIGIKLPQSQKLYPEAAVEIVFFHEFAHILQFLNMINDKKDEPILWGLDWRAKKFELNADCVASFLFKLHQTYLSDYDYNPTEVNGRNAMAKLTTLAIGDNYINNIKHHGTHEERVRAFEQAEDAYFEGFFQGTPPQKWTSYHVLRKCMINGADFDVQLKPQAQPTHSGRSKRGYTPSRNPKH